jgi:hypothetical protein
VVSLSSVASEIELGAADYQQLLVNVVTWAANQ